MLTRRHARVHRCCCNAGTRGGLGTNQVNRPPHDHCPPWQPRHCTIGLPTGPATIAVAHLMPRLRVWIECGTVAVRRTTRGTAWSRCAVTTARLRCIASKTVHPHSAAPRRNDAAAVKLTQQNHTHPHTHTHTRSHTTQLLTATPHWTRTLSTKASNKRG